MTYLKDGVNELWANVFSLLSGERLRDNTPGCFDRLDPDERSTVIVACSKYFCDLVCGKWISHTVNQEGRGDIEDRVGVDPELRLRATDQIQQCRWEGDAGSYS